MIRDTLQQLTECPTCIEIGDLVKTMRACNTLTFLCAILKLVVVFATKLLSWSKFFGLEDTVPLALCILNEEDLARMRKFGTIHGNQPLDEEQNEDPEGDVDVASDLVSEKYLLKEPLLPPPIDTTRDGNASSALAPPSTDAVASGDLQPTHETDTKGELDTQ